MALNPGAEPLGLASALLKRLPDGRRKVSWLTCGKDILQGLEHRCRWHETEGGHVPELIELEAKDGDVDGLRRLIDDALGPVVDPAGRSLGREPRGPAIGEWFLVSA